MCRCEYAIIEGAMGYFDGIYNTFDNSSFHISRELDISAILVYRPQGEMFSVIPKIKGMVEFPDSKIKGLILNKVSKDMYLLLKENIEEYIEIRGKPFRYSASYSHLFGTKIIKILLSNMGKIHKLNLKLNEELGAIKISLAQKESMYKETFFQNTFGIAYADKDGLILDTNPHYAKMLGYEKDEIVGRNISEFTIFEDMQVSKSAFIKIYKNQNHSQE